MGLGGEPSGKAREQEMRKGGEEEGLNILCI